MANLKIGLAGNPNVGKTTLFNTLTGLNQHVGNWPGKTVAQAKGHYKHSDNEVEVIDLPGNYALSAHSIEEIVSRDFIVDEDSDVIVNIIDAANIERNLYLTVQMMELGANLVIALNMNRYAQDKGYTIDATKLSELLGVPVVEIEANSDIGKEELLKTIEQAALNPVDSSKKLVYHSELKEHLTELQAVIEEDKNLLDVPSSWTAIKLLENDEIVEEKIEGSSKRNNIVNESQKVKDHLKGIFGEGSEEVIANARYAFIEGLLKESLTKPASAKATMSEKIDRILTNRILGLPIFVIIMYLMFDIVANQVGPLQDFVAGLFEMIGEWIIATLGETMLSSFLVDGLIGGVGGVLEFVPQIMMLFLIISFLEDCGYLARAAFVIDRIMHKFVGLHGKAFIPMLLGFGCGIPGIMATRAMENEKDRLITMMIIPFMSCSARLPVYVMLVGVFFSANQGLVITSLYWIGILVAMIVAFILRKTVFKEMEAPFVMELPDYKLPTIRGILMHTLEKSWGFIKKAGTIILLAAIVIWILSYFPAGVEYGSEQSLIGSVGKVAAPVFAPLGFGEWQPAVALVFGLVAKEVVVSTFSSLFGVAEEGAGIAAAMQGIFTPLTAFVFMVFVLLYIPCFAAIGAIKEETGGYKYPLMMCGVTLVTAYLVSFFIYMVGLALGFG
ncbi:ferrous iron transport protein B [Methanobrevibacter olleyae]|uniref:Ferrous iron transport protein B n=1 Tax=Methanobrevibacter olleyae TaxID=294671 RepID=A0A126QX75_METOL|nr:ferrous iron transport protein B [Methanobrevibacter olleyae]AMK14763.1 ferrous iron transport protein B FeoB [Methanobrevibacter olleyae]